MTRKIVAFRIRNMVRSDVSRDGEEIDDAVRFGGRGVRLQVMETTPLAGEHHRDGAGGNILQFAGGFQRRGGKSVWPDGSCHECKFVFRKDLRGRFRQCDRLRAKGSVRFGAAFDLDEEVGFVKQRIRFYAVRTAP